MYIPTINTEKTGENIKKALREKGLKVKDIQVMYGFNTPQAVYKWIKGTSLPTLDNLVILSEVLNTPIDSLIAVDMVDCGGNTG